MKKNKENRVKLESNDKLTLLVREKDIEYWEDLLIFIRDLPYGRNTNREDFSLVIKELRGTCSSKHAFLKEIADRNGIENVKLILGIYKMNENNTPKIKNTISKIALDYIPEAHCYLKIENIVLDLTMNESNFEKIKDDVIKEIEINADDVGEFKVEFHKNYLKNWIEKENMKISFEEIWKQREKCIRKLEEKLK